MSKSKIFLIICALFILSICSIHFIADANTSIEAPDSVIAGSSINVKWTGPLRKNDVLQILNYETGQTFNPKTKTFYPFIYLNHQAESSPTVISAPDNEGTYLLRYRSLLPQGTPVSIVNLYNKIHNTVLAEKKFTVTKIDATLNAPDSVIAGFEIKIPWTGPKNEYDRLKIFSLDGKKSYAHAYFYENDFISPTEIKVPDEPGEYLIHYWAKNDISLAVDKFTVTERKAEVDVPEHIFKNFKFDVAWSGPKNKLDKLQIFNDENDEALDFLYVNQKSQDATIQFKAPAKAGRYVIRYLNEDNQVLAQDKFYVN